MSFGVIMIMKWNLLDSPKMALDQKFRKNPGKIAPQNSFVQHRAAEKETIAHGVAHSRDGAQQPGLTACPPFVPERIARQCGFRHKPARDRNIHIASLDGFEKLRDHSGGIAHFGGHDADDCAFGGADAGQNRGGGAMAVFAVQGAQVGKVLAQIVGSFAAAIG